MEEELVAKNPSRRELREAYERLDYDEGARIHSHLAHPSDLLHRLSLYLVTL
jgi:hypothetical protein